MLFITFLILDLICILLSLVMRFTGRVRWARAHERPTGARMAEPGEAKRPPPKARLAALLPLGFAILSGIIGLIGHATQFPAWRLIVVLIFAAAITALICLLTARLLLGLGPKPPQPT